MITCWPCLDGWLARITRCTKAGHRPHSPCCQLPLLFCMYHGDVLFFCCYAQCTIIKNIPTQKIAVVRFKRFICMEGPWCCTLACATVARVSLRHELDLVESADVRYFRRNLGGRFHVFLVGQHQNGSNAHLCGRLGFFNVLGKKHDISWRFIHLLEHFTVGVWALQWTKIGVQVIEDEGGQIALTRLFQELFGGQAPAVAQYIQFDALLEGKSIYLWNRQTSNKIPCSITIF